MVPSEAWYQVTTNFDSQSEKETNHITVKSTMSSTCWSRLMGFLSVNVGSLSNLDRCRHPCASRPRESDSRYSWGSSWGFDNFIHDCLCVCVMFFFLKVKGGEVVWMFLSTKINMTVEIRWETASKIRAKTLQDLPEDTLCDTMQLPRDTPSWEHDQAKRMISSSKPLWASPVIALCIQFASEIIQKTERSDQESKRKSV